MTAAKAARPARLQPSPGAGSPVKTAREMRTAWVRGRNSANVFIQPGKLSRGKKTPEKKSIGVMTSSV